MPPIRDHESQQNTGNWELDVLIQERIQSAAIFVPQDMDLSNPPDLSLVSKLIRRLDTPVWRNNNYYCLLLRSDSIFQHKLVNVTRYKSLYNTETIYKNNLEKWIVLYQIQYKLYDLPTWAGLDIVKTLKNHKLKRPNINLEHISNTLNNQSDFQEQEDTFWIFLVIRTCSYLNYNLTR